ncbi:MAG: oligosaccharide flippase family protein [Patescibacteria group bacterium]|nr:oligosaccharide flippase family protein [Patescibacteria group bacterium]
MDKIKKKTIISGLSLFFNSGYAAILSFFANLILTIIVSPKIFGVYFTVLSIISIFNYFSDVGLAASLVQRKNLNKKMVATVFTFQQLFVALLVSLGFLLTPIVVNFYQLEKSGKYLYWSLLVSFFFSSLKTIPSVFLERKIEFQKITFVQVVENTFFYMIVIILAIWDLDLYSFTFGVLGRSLIGLVIIYSLSPWPPSIQIDLTVLKELLKFGLPFQGSSVLALIKDEVMTLYLGKTIGFESLGYLGWAKKWAESPIRIVMDSFSRLLFPLFSKFQNDKNKMRKIIERAVFYQNLIVIPAIALLVVVMPGIVELIPRYQKWQPALGYFYLFSLSAFFSSFSTPFINLMNSLGRVDLSLRFMVGWTLATWFLVPILVSLFGPAGFPLTILFLSSSFIVVIAASKRLVEFNFLKNTLPFFISAGAILFGTSFSFFQIDHLALETFLKVFFGIIGYVVILRFFFKISLYQLVKELWRDYQR